MKLRALLNSIAYWTLPPGIKNTLRELKGDPAYNAMKPLLQNNLALKDKHRGERCFLLCTGPSINSQDLSGLKNEISFACSRFYLHEQVEIIKPKYYIQPSWHEPISQDAYKKTISKAYERMPWATAVLGSNAFSILDDSSLFNGNIFYYYGGVPYENCFKIDLTTKTMNLVAVSTQAICTAIYMGFKKIYLLGCDHDGILYFGKSRHFYKESLAEFKDDWSGGLLTEFEGGLNLWKTYLAIKKIANLENIEIINLTPGSLLDVFERNSLVNVLDS